MKRRAGSLAGGGLRSLASRARFAVVVVPSLVLGGVVSGAALPPAPAAASEELVETARTAASAPSPDDLAAVDPAQTTVPDPAPVVEPEPVPPVVEEPAPPDPVDPAPPAVEPAPVEPAPVDPVPVGPAAPGPTTPEPTVPDPATDEPATPTSPAPAPQSRSAAPQPGVPDAAAAVDDEVVPAVVPDPTTTQSVVTVKVGGIRTTLTQVSPLAGVTLQLFDGGTAGATTPRLEPWATCVSDATGDCSFVVPETGDGGVNRDARFWVKQAGAAPSGYFANAALAVGGDTTSQTYQFRTGLQLRGGTTYTSTTDFMVSSGRGFTASGGIWQSSLADPGLPAQCGLRVALVVDLSGSVGRYITEMRGAASTFVDSLTGTPSSVALFTFADNAPAATGANLGLTPVSTPAGAQTVKNRIASYTAGFDTNWDRGLYQVAASSTAFDVAVVLTDGNPTVYAAHEGPGDLTRFREVENGIFSANAVKAEGTRVIAVGVGDGLGGAPDNLRAISGPAAGSDYYQTDDYAEAGEALRDLALGTCNGSVSVVKQVVPSSTTGETVTGATPSGGWTFEASTSSPGVTPSEQSGTTVSGTGAVNFPLEYAGGSSTATVTVTEQQKDGFTLVTQASKRAVCTDIATGDPVEVTNDPDDALGFSVDAPATAAITCTVYNRAPQPQASLTVDKEWVVNGTTYTEGNQPIGLAAQLTVDQTPQPWSSPRDGFVEGAQVEVAETTAITGRDLCEVTGSRITEQDGQTVDLPVPSTITLEAGDGNRLTVTNTVTCEAELTLVKQVAGGPAQPTDWALDAVAPDGSLPGPSGATGTPGATALVTPGVRYPLVESGDGRYVQTIRPGAVLVPPSTGSWQCEQVTEDGTVVPGFNDGINGGVTVPLGFRVRCTSVNQSATLTLVKEVVNDDTGTAEPADWSLTATPTGDVPDDVVTESVTGSTEGVTVQVRPGTVYDLTESGPEGYALASLECSTGPGDTFVPATSVNLAALDSVTCVFVNDDVPPPPSWLLSKTSDPADGSVVTEGQTVTYTLHAVNDGQVDVLGATAVDDLTDVLDDATLVEPLDPSLALDPETGLLTWQLPDLVVGAAEATVQYAVVVSEVETAGTLHNVVTAGTPGGRCPAELPPVGRELAAATFLAGAFQALVENGCETDHPTGEVDLSVAKTHAAVVDDAVDSGSGQRLDYTVEVTNVGVDPAADVVVTDPLPDSVDYVEGTLVVPAGWTAQIVDGLLTASSDGDLAAGEVATFTYAVLVGDVPRAVPGGAHDDIVNTACVSSAGLDADLADNCATDTVPVKSVAVTALAVCVNDTPYVSYEVTPSNVVGDPVVALIWWTAAAYEARDVTIGAADTAALLADGASQVDRVTLPDGWVQGDTITGEQLWPGAAVDADGDPVAWPGWTQRADGTWFLDPAAPFYELRGETVVEVRVNPSTGSTLVYPPATPDCDANPPVVDPPTVAPASGAVPRGGRGVVSSPSYLPRTGAEIGAAALLGTGLLALGAMLVGSRRRRDGLTRDGRL
ncbi:DUF7927 domain-containing protein [Sanguibacter inulinus]|uniref:DUF11 domain-containing protein n=1 Tax=Sanguibacter inulinus TaxID=60922 RepID=A0A853ES91_9MICO|nr:VWA domain-containing protein [Sanguibacter inulinus]MBF0722216.1 DUF11 domain-containing protein [Sanguibacter inulinus]NYS93361.1 DUF11 domain-containing protein [Sanguibacter inulinus]